MINFVVRRTLLGLSSLLFISAISFVIIQLPEGDYIDSWYGNVTEGDAQQGITITLQELDKLRALYGLDKPLYVQYFKFVVNLVRFDFGITLEYSLPVSVLLREKMLLTVVLAGFTIIFTWMLAIPIGIYSAVRQHSLGDYTFTFIGFIGLAVPDFLLALVLMYFAFQYFGTAVGRAILFRVHRGALEHSQGARSAGPPLDTGLRPGHVRHGGAHQDHAGQRAGRAA